MAGICIRFGYYPVHCDTRTGDISLTTLPGLKKMVDEVEACQSIVGDWLYVPPHTGRPNRIFGLPMTHVLTHENADSVEHLEFLAWCVSFFVGMLEFVIKIR